MGFCVFVWNIKNTICVGKEEILDSFAVTFDIWTVFAHSRGSEGFQCPLLVY